MSYPGFPENVLEPSTPYVYFNSLVLSKGPGRIIYNKVKPYFSNTINNITHDTTSINNALDFLYQIISVEAEKEMAFINYFSNRFQDIKELKVPTSGEDWSNFIQIIQQSIAIGSQQLENLRNEKSRLQRNEELTRNNNQESYKYLKTAQDYTSKEMTNLYNFIKSGNNNTNGEKILKLILEKFGNSLFELQDGKLIFNQSTLLALITSIQSLVMKQYTDIQFENTKLDIEKIQKILDDPTFTNNVNSFLGRVKALPFLGDDLARSLGFEKYDDEFSAEQSQLLYNLSQQQKIINKSKESLTKTLQSYFKHGFISDNAFKIISNGNAYAEIESMLNFAMSKGSIYASNTGGAGAKPDNLLAYLTIDLSQLDLSDEEVRNALTTIHDQMLELDHSLEKTNTMDYYKKQQQKWDETEKIINEQLLILQKKYKELSQCFIIEDSTKNYTSLYASQHFGKMNAEFHGGSLGPSISDQMAKINAIYHEGGLSELDTDWLIAVAINAGQGMIARDYKHSLEQYLATFACILLFDDQINIAKEAFDKLKQNTNNIGSSVQKIHLFSLNGGYYPLSFILQLTYDKLQKAYNEAEAIVDSGSGAEITITGFVKEPEPPYRETKMIKQWSNVAQEALKTTKLKISFLTNFMGVLNALYPN